MKKLIIKPGCIGCGLCQSIEPEVFQVRDISRLRDTIDYNVYEEKIERAVRECPVHAISYEK